MFGWRSQDAIGRERPVIKSADKHLIDGRLY